MDQHHAREAVCVPPSKGRGPSQEKTAHTRGLILAAAMEEFLEKGFTASTMQSIATRAGLAKGTPYRYFPTKQALFLDLVRQVVTDPLREANSEPMAPGESVRAYCQRSLVPVMAVFESAGRASVARLVLTEARAFPELAEAYRRDVYLPFLAHLASLVATARARGEIAPHLADHAPHLLAAPLWLGMLNNGILLPDHPIQTGLLFEAQLDALFPPPGGKA